MSAMIVQTSLSVCQSSIVSAMIVHFIECLLG